jgi:aminoglycoside phosphotransferase (APT) family kinase protein
VSPTGDPAGSLSRDLLAELQARDLDVAAIEGLRRLSGGASRETWSLQTVTGDGRSLPRILQRTRPGATVALPMTAEAAVLRAAAAVDVPVAAVVASGDASGALGSGWMLVDHVEGETIARRILRDEEYAVARGRLVAQAGAALAAIHRIPVDGVSLPAGDALQLRQIVEALGEPHPALELGFRWLEANRPTAARQTVVHGDFRLGNLVVGDTGLRAVLDWELAHVGDPHEDLGWFCVRAWRFGEAAPVAGLGERSALYEAYRAAGGEPVDEAAAHWWEVLGSLRWGAICMLQANAHLSGASRSVELAAIGRRTCEAEYDLLLLLRQAWGRPTSTPGGASPDASLDASLDAGGTATPHDRPTAPELLDAVAEYLTADVLEATEGRVRFHARVAANVVALVAREIQLGPAQVDAHRARLDALGFADDAGLVEALRTGALDDRLPEIGDTVWEAVCDKVLVANPGYLEPAGGADRVAERTSR